MSTQVQHPLAVFLAARATPEIEPEEEPCYDPVAQLQVRWKDMPDHMEILCSGKRTGDPSTRSATTSHPTHVSPSDDDTDDSGT
jgi:hypothetical protein